MTVRKPLPSAIAVLAFAPPLAAQNDWSPAHLFTPRQATACCYDSVRDRMVVFGGFAHTQALGDTWEHGNGGWSHRLPTVAPPPRFNAAMTYDAARQRAVLFGGSQPGSIVLGDQWEWDGSAWTQVQPAVRPSARGAAAIAYDAARQVVVLFGGQAGGAYLGDTWEWNGATWTQRATPTAPAARLQASMAFDSARGRCVLYGGYLGAGAWPRDTWEWDGSAWSQTVTPQVPTSDFTQAMAFDPVRQRTVLFGGLTQSPSQQLDETWEYDGANWQALATATRPTAQQQAAAVWHDGLQRTVVLGGPNDTRLFAWDGAIWTEVAAAEGPLLSDGTMAEDPSSGQLMLFGTRRDGVFENWQWGGLRWLLRPSANVPDQAAFEVAADPLRQRIVLFGGRVGNVVSDRIWEWNGVDWQLLPAIAAPLARSGTAMAFDFVGGRVVLFGGDVRTSPTMPVQFAGDTWSFDGTAWTQLAPAARPIARFGHSMASDVARARIVLYGGVDGAGLRGDTWEFDGATWALRAATGPSPRANAPMAYDPIRQLVALVSGPNGAVNTTPNETWEWNGAVWTLRATATVPNARGAGSLGFDPIEGQLVAYGGLICQGTCEWTFDTLRLGTGIAAEIVEVGPGCGGAFGVPVLGGDEPYRGHTAFRLEVRSAAPLTFGLVGVAATTSTTALGGGCTLQLGGVADLFLVATDTAGTGRVALPIPAQASLLGAIAFVQAAVLDATGAQGTITLTPARRLRLGE